MATSSFFPRGTRAVTVLAEASPPVGGAAAAAAAAAAADAAAAAADRAAEAEVGGAAVVDVTEAEAAAEAAAAAAELHALQAMRTAAGRAFRPRLRRAPARFVGGAVGGAATDAASALVRESARLGATVWRCGAPLVGEAGLLIVLPRGAARSAAALRLRAAVDALGAVPPLDVSLEGAMLPTRLEAAPVTVTDDQSAPPGAHGGGSEDEGEDAGEQGLPELSPLAGLDDDEDARASLLRDRIALAMVLPESSWYQLYDGPSGLGGGGGDDDDDDDDDDDAEREGRDDDDEQRQYGFGRRLALRGAGTGATFDAFRLLVTNHEAGGGTAGTAGGEEAREIALAGFELFADAEAVQGEPGSAGADDDSDARDGPASAHGMDDVDVAAAVASSVADAVPPADVEPDLIFTSLTPDARAAVGVARPGGSTESMSKADVLPGCDVEALLLPETTAAPVGGAQPRALATFCPTDTAVLICPGDGRALVPERIQLTTVQAGGGATAAGGAHHDWTSDPAFLSLEGAAARTPDEAADLPPDAWTLLYDGPSGLLERSPRGWRGEAIELDPAVGAAHAAAAGVANLEAAREAAALAVLGGASPFANQVARPSQGPVRRFSAFRVIFRGCYGGPATDTVHVGRIAIEGVVPRTKGVAGRR